MPTADGVKFTARLPKVEEAGALKDRVDEAWQSIKAGLIRAVSIGFRPLADGIEHIKGGGIRFTKTEVYELSLVTVPACSAAVIQAIKSVDLQGDLAASGEPVNLRTRPGVSGHTKAAPIGPVSLISRRKDALK